MTLEKLSIEGFKSISQLIDFEIKSLNVLIGANGAGKSNFVSLFHLLRKMMDENLQDYIMKSGGPSSFFFNGPKITPEIKMHFMFGDNQYRFTLAMTADEKLLIKSEEQRYIKSSNWQKKGGDQYESSLKKNKEELGIIGKHGIGHYIYDAISKWIAYHFHDTSMFSGMRLSESVDDYKYLRNDARNIAPFLLNLKNNKPDYYKKIVEVIQLVAPFFNDFDLIPEQRGPATVVKLNWSQKGSDYPFAPYQLSDGTLRFICLAAALLQPELPSCLVIDEPELGLHPYAIEVLSELIKLASRRTNLSRIIISTQSPTLLSHFEPKDVIIVDRKDGASTFTRLDKIDLSAWLEEYSLGEIWCKNLIEGMPSNE